MSAAARANEDQRAPLHDNQRASSPTGCRGSWNSVEAITAGGAVDRLHGPLPGSRVGEAKAAGEEGEPPLGNVHQLARRHREREYAHAHPATPTSQDPVAPRQGRRRTACAPIAWNSIIVQAEASPP